jgi:hypothetical protein
LPGPNELMTKRTLLDDLSHRRTLPTNRKELLKTLDPKPVDSNAKPYARVTKNVSSAAKLDICPKTVLKMPRMSQRTQGEYVIDADV